DHAFVRVAPETFMPNQGALGNTGAELTESTRSHLAVRFPDLYTDWERAKPRSIRWETFNNAADAPVRIDLYQDGPDGPAFVVNITLATPDDGDFVWIPETSGIGFGTFGLRIQVSRSEERRVGKEGRVGGVPE